MAKAIEKRLSGARGEREARAPAARGPTDRTVTQIGFPAPCRRRGKQAPARPRALPPGPTDEGVLGARVARVGLPELGGLGRECQGPPGHSCGARVVPGPGGYGAGPSSTSLCSERA